MSKVPSPYERLGITPVVIEDKADKLTSKDLKKLTKAQQKKSKKKPLPPVKTQVNSYDPKIHPQMVIDWLAKGYTQKTIVSELKISTTTWEVWKKHPEMKEAFDHGMALCEKYYVDLGQKLATGQIKGNAAAFCFLAKNVLRWRDNYDDKPEPQPVTINFGIAPPIDDSK